MADNSHASRSIVFDAATELATAGYHCIRVAGRTRPFDLIAWNGSRTLLLVIRRARSLGIAACKDEVHRLSTLVTSRSLPGIVHLWIFHSFSWYRYEILAGGALPITWRKQT